jgi:hypothetical protein
MNTVYVALGAALVGTLGLLVWVVASDPTLRLIFLVLLGIAGIGAMVFLLARLTDWAEDVLERGKK